MTDVTTTRWAGLTAAPLAAVAVAGLLAGGTGQASPAPVHAGRGFTAYVAGTGVYPGGLSKDVTPINTATSRPGKPIKSGPGPAAIAITPDGQTAYVANFASDTVTPIATATNTPGKPIKVGGDPVAIAFAPRPARS